MKIIKGNKTYRRVRILIQDMYYDKEKKYTNCKKGSKTITIQDVKNGDLNKVYDVVFKALSKEIGF